MIGFSPVFLSGCNAACDGDEDGFCLPEDCNDSDPLVNPDARERCNGIDDNCNGGISAMETDDGDGDGTAECFDCNDSDPATFPGATELCDGLDNDCDGEVRQDEFDNDGDGYRGCDDCDDTDDSILPGAEEVCDGVDSDCDGVLPPVEEDQDDDGFFECNGDCDPNRDDIFPGAEEVCDGRDNDCDGEMSAEETVDNDGDGHPPCTDCDDDDFSVSPDVEELCDGIDNNCDGEAWIDPKTGDPMEKDDDEDGWLDCAGDCDDEDPEVRPSAYEILDNAIDDDCDGTADNQPGWTPYFDDAETLLAQLDGECGWHYTETFTADFDSGVGDPVGTAYPGVEFSAELGGAAVPVIVADAVVPYAGSGYLTTDGPVDSLTATFDDLQDFVVYAAQVENSAAWGDYSIDILQFGTSLILGPMFGEAPGGGWAVRGASSHWNLGYDEMVFLPATSGEILLLDALSYCR